MYLCLSGAWRPSCSSLAQEPIDAGLAPFGALVVEPYFPKIGARNSPMGITPKAIAKIKKAKLSPLMRPNIEGFGISICLQDCKSFAFFIVVTIRPLRQLQPAKCVP
jgi:hypothetical protein